MKISDGASREVQSCECERAFIRYIFAQNAVKCWRTQCIITRIVQSEAYMVNWLMDASPNQAIFSLITLGACRIVPAMRPIYPSPFNRPASAPHRFGNVMPKSWMWRGVLVALEILLAKTVAAQTLFDSRLTWEDAANGTLSQPTAMAFIGSADYLVCEKGTGKVRRVINGNVQAGQVLDLPVNADSERGLLGMAIHPNFSSNGWVYLFYSRANADNQPWLDNRVSRFTWNGSSLGGETLIVSFLSDSNQANGPNHNGGIIQFGADGKLYGITGDLNRNRFEQNGTGTTNVSGVGGVFRVNDNGTIPGDNPFAAQSSPELRRLYAYGIRNSFGMAFDPFTNQLWETENGPGSYDEVNYVLPGFNSGWIDLMGPDSRDSNGVSDLSVVPNSNYSDPEYSWFSPVAVTSIIFPRNSNLPADIRVKAIVGDNNFGNLYAYPLNAARNGFSLTGGNSDLVADNDSERDQYRLGNGWGVTTDLEVGPDGWLYVVDLANGTVRRIKRAANCPDCPADVAPASCGNGIVNVDDLLAVINAWGACSPTGGPCPDLAPQPIPNFAINVDDLLALINSWGSCP